MLKPDLRRKPKPPTGAGQAQGKQRILAIDKQLAIGIARLPDPAPRYEEADKRGHINGPPHPVIIRRGQMKPVTPTTKQGLHKLAAVPERVARRGIHLADRAIREIDRCGQPIIPALVQRMKRRQSTGRGPRIVIHHHDPVGIPAFDRLAHPLFKPA